MATRSFTELARRLLDGGFNPFQPDAARGLYEQEEFPALLAELPGAADSSGVNVLSILRVMAVDADLVRQRQEPDIVATFPATVRTNARRTGPVVRSLIASARREILVVGYTLTDGEFVQGLAEARRRGVHVVVVGDRAMGGVKTVLGGWPTGVENPVCYVNAAMASASTMSSMHSKLLVVDAAEVLVTSANFTWHGHHENIEFGMLLRGSPGAAARDFFHRLISSGVLVKCEL
jgi:phosphatidylserine/phosphatidylglycerophosphate/cardiolipin synthase-like enzyme